jgi:hypothetical protein
MDIFDLVWFGQLFPLYVHFKALYMYNSSLFFEKNLFRVLMLLFIGATCLLAACLLEEWMEKYQHGEASGRRKTRQRVWVQRVPTGSMEVWSKEPYYSVFWFLFLYSSPSFCCRCMFKYSITYKRIEIKIILVEELFLWRAEAITSDAAFIKS